MTIDFERSFGDFALRCEAPAAPTEANVKSRVRAVEGKAREAGVKAACRMIGTSRQGRSLFGIHLGEGALKVSLAAGAHADEPAGPLAALALAAWLAGDASGRALCTKTSWRICPHVNPDGAERNAGWFADPPDLRRYLEGAMREPPGDDVEFDYPHGGNPAARPENEAVASFLAEGGPVHLHASLHGMGLAEGAWWLIGRQWVERTASLRAELAALFKRLNLGVHDIDRKGEKGFTRIEPGFSTTPTGAAMREHFNRRGETDTARLFLSSSMEFMQSLGGDPLVMVSEIPLFRIHGGGRPPDPPGDETPFAQARSRLGKVRATLSEGDKEPMHRLARQFDIRPVPWSVQIAGVAMGVLTAVDWLLRFPGEELDNNAC